MRFSLNPLDLRFATQAATPLVLALAIGAAAFAQEAAEPTPPSEGTPPAAGEEAAATAAAPITPEQAQTALVEGQGALNAADWEKAFKEFTTVLQWGAANAYTEQGVFAVLAGYTGRGQALAGLEDYEAALQEFKAALDQNSEFTPALIGRGLMYLDLGVAEQALPDFEAAVKISRADIRAQFGLGKSYVLLGGWQQAMKPLSRVIAAQPELGEAYRLRGSALAAVYKSVEAIDDLQKAIQLDATDYEAYFTLGMLYLRDERHEDAIVQLRKAIENYKPKKGQEPLPYLQGYLSLASAYLEHGKMLTDPAAQKAAYQTAVDETQKLLEQYDEKNPMLAPFRAAVLYSRGVGERLLDDYGRAVKTLSEAINLNPDMSEAYFKRGICYHFMGEDKMAISDFVQAANINYEDPRANLWEGFTHAQLGDYYEAVRAYGDAIAASDRYTPAYVNRGLAYMKLGEFDKAVADLNEAIRIDPTDAEHYFKRGLAYERLGDFEKASDSFASAIEFNKQHQAAYRHMAGVLDSLGRRELAGEYRQKAESLGRPTPGE